MRGTALYHRRKEDLCEHSAELAHSCTEAVSCTSYSCREDLGGRDECCCVGTEVEEELGEDVEDEEVRFGEDFPSEAKDAEDDCQDCESPDLDGFATELVDGEDREPVAGECAGADQHDLAGCCVTQV